MKQKCRNVLKPHKASKNKHTIKSAVCTIQSNMVSLHIHAKQAKVPKKNHCTVGHSRNWIAGTNQLTVTVHTTSATRDLLLVQQNEFCWTSNRISNHLRANEPWRFVSSQVIYVGWGGIQWTRHTVNSSYANFRRVTVTRKLKRCFTCWFVTK